MANATPTVQRRLRSLFLANGIGGSLAMGELVLLLALTLGASDGQMAILYAAPFITSLLAVVAPMALNGRDTTTIWAGFWFARALVMVGYFCLPLISDPNTQVWLVIGVFLLFSLCRSVGMIGNLPVVKALVPPRQLPGIIAAMMSWFFMAAVVASLATAGVFALPWPEGSLHGFYVLLVISMGFNLYTAWRISRLPPTGRLTGGNLSGIGESFRLLLRPGPMRVVAVLTILQATVGVLLRYPLNVLTREYGWSEGQVFWLVVGGYCTAILVAQLLRAIGRRVDARALLVGTHGLIALTALGWALIDLLPAVMVGPVAVVLFIAIGVGSWGSMTVIARMQADHLPKDRAPQVTAAYSAMAVIGAVVATSIAIGLDNSPADVTSLGISHRYSLLFVILAAVAGTISLRAWLGRNLDRPEQPSDLHLLSPVNLLALYRSWRLEQRHGTTAAATSVGMDALLRGRSQVSQVILTDYLGTSEVIRRYAAHHSLMSKAEPALADAIRADAFDPGSPTRYEALTNLGRVGTADDCARLAPLLEDDDPWVRSLAAKGLLRLGHTIEPTQAIDLYEQAENPRQRLDLLVGLVEAGQTAVVDQLLASELEQPEHHTWTATVLVYAATTRGRRDAMVDLLDSERQRADAGIDRLVELVSPNDVESLQPAMLESRLRADDHEGLMESLAKHLPRPWLKPADRFAALGVTLLWWLDYQASYAADSDADDERDDLLRATRVTERPTSVGDIDVEAELAAFVADAEAAEATEPSRDPATGDADSGSDIGGDDSTADDDQFTAPPVSPAPRSADAERSGSDVIDDDRDRTVATEGHDDDPKPA